MHSVRSVKNQYLGINAHLHSFWQSEGGWAGFHGNHLADLMRTLRAQLLPIGYTVEYESSIQIRRLDGSIDAPESDVAIFDLDPQRGAQLATPIQATPGALVMTPPQAPAEDPVSDKEYGALAIYELLGGRRVRNTPVAWLELLSPSNKGNGRDAEIYRNKRAALVHSGLVFIELDYLHESAPTLARVADYRRTNGHAGKSEAHPYRIAVIDPRPTYATGRAYIAEFDVDAPIPIVAIALNAGDILRFDFGIPYRKTFEETLYGLELVDYAQFPLRFDRYRPTDQARIAARMLAVLTAAKQEIDLETGPFPVTETSLQEALYQIKAIQG